tara:strand:+ start:399 stop:632 length:234 start_codon:yes stop_codon:yes gene_type:complete
MKAYQVEWACMLNSGSCRSEDIHRICDEITSDDTGRTDHLAVILASKLSEVNNELMDANEVLDNEYSIPSRSRMENK